MTELCQIPAHWRKTGRVAHFELKHTGREDSYQRLEMNLCRVLGEIRNEISILERSPQGKWVELRES